MTVRELPQPAAGAILFQRLEYKMYVVSGDTPKYETVLFPKETPAQDAAQNQHTPSTAHHWSHPGQAGMSTSTTASCPFLHFELNSRLFH